LSNPFLLHDLILTKSPQNAPYRMVTVLTTSEARANLHRLIDETAESHEPIAITGKGANAVLVSESDWNAMHENLYLLSIKGMREFIKGGMAQTPGTLAKDLDW